MYTNQCLVNFTMAKYNHGNEQEIVQNELSYICLAGNLL